MQMPVVDIPIINENRVLELNVTPLPEVFDQEKGPFPVDGKESLSELWGDDVSPDHRLVAVHRTEKGEVVLYLGLVLSEPRQILRVSHNSISVETCDSSYAPVTNE